MKKSKLPMGFEMFSDRIDSLTIDKGVYTIQLKAPFIFYGSFVITAEARGIAWAHLDHCEELDMETYNKILDTLF